MAAAFAIRVLCDSPYLPKKRAVVHGVRAVVLSRIVFPVALIAVDGLLAALAAVVDAQR